jgi:hypothetical protein
MPQQTTAYIYPHHPARRLFNFTRAVEDPTLLLLGDREQKLHGICAVSEFCHRDLGLQPVNAVREDDGTITLCEGPQPDPGQRPIPLAPSMAAAWDIYLWLAYTGTRISLGVKTTVWECVMTDREGCEHATQSTGVVESIQESQRMVMRALRYHDDQLS